MRLQGKAGEEALYEERQHFAAWVYGVSVAVVAGGFAPLFLSLRDNPPFGSYLLGGMLYTGGGIAALFLLYNLFHARTVVSAREVYVRLGCFFPFIWKRIPCDSIAEARAVTYRPLRDAGGWGYRFGRFEGHCCAFINARGNRGVLIDTREGRRYIVGSQRPEVLYSAILRACSIKQH